MSMPQRGPATRPSTGSLSPHLGKARPPMSADLTLSAHLGTHIDAPCHLAEGAPSLDQLALAPYWGLAQVVTVARSAGALRLADFAHADLRRAPRVLVRSQASSGDPHVFPEAFVHPSPELADDLGRLGVCLYGTDAPSVDAPADVALPGHRALLANGIAILEGLDLSGAGDGLYELVALPLKIAGGDGSPVRVVLRRPTGNTAPGRDSSF